ncbi:hypothetical protein HHK36_008751 [Tetracentron sinense]|uniref:Uncharacterized protein n=1 Tax=Tetracentron sinense TaxID=13715 RepID=A0A834ZGW7_TETSI|nr:hypothetical protein HHK36_008751 [Tetracentron sinense]
MGTKIKGATSSLLRRNAICSPSANLDLPLKRNSSSFLIANGIHSQLPTSNLEMVSVRSLSYTSLRDLLPSSSAGISSPTFPRNQSWEEIPIKNPLVKHAAWAYLQPMLTSPETDDRGCFPWLNVKCSGECVTNTVNGCFEFITSMLYRRSDEGFGDYLERKSERRIDGNDNGNGDF